MGYWDTDYWPISKCALCNVLEQAIRAGGGPFKGNSVADSGGTWKTA